MHPEFTPLMFLRRRSSWIYPGSHCVIFHRLAILQLKTNGNPAKWAPTAIKEVILFTILKTKKIKNFKSIILE
jgi:hypothetical protein